MVKTIRSPRYLLPLAVLAAVTVAALAVVAGQPGQAEQSQSRPGALVPVAVAQPTTSAADARRIADLRTLAGLLDQYRSATGAYPSTQMYFNTICTQAFDAGCLLTTISKQIPTGDGANPYWYRSDGATYALFARADTALVQADCPAELPPALAGGSVICLTSGGGP